MKKKIIVFSMLFVLCLTFTACGNDVISANDISNISGSDLEGVEYLSVYQMLRSDDDRYCIDVYTSQEANAASYILPLAEEFYGETQTFGVVGARSVTQYFDAKEFYEEWWKAGVKNNEFVYNTRFSYKLNEMGEITYLSEYDYYADNDVTGASLTNDDDDDNNDDDDMDLGEDLNDDMSFDGNEENEDETLG